MKDPDIEFLVATSPEPTTSDENSQRIYDYSGFESFEGWAYHQFEKICLSPSEEYNRDISLCGHPIFVPEGTTPASQYRSAFSERLEIDRPDNYDTPHP